MTPATADKYISALSNLFKRARRRGDVKDNPFSEQRPPRAKQQAEAIFSIEELNILLSHQAGTDLGTTLRWMVLIALFSGTRQGEISQLRKQDIVTGAIPYFNVTAESGSLKTAAAARKLPIHSELIRLGLLDYVHHIPDGSRLFPWCEGKATNAVADGFKKWRARIGLGRKGLHFHSLRKNFTSPLDAAGVPQSDVAAIVGHERGFTFDVYSAGPGLARLAGIVEKVEYSGLRIAHLHVG
jgi:integrase